MNPSSLAGVITAIGTLFTAVSLIIVAITGLLRSRKVEAKIDTVHHIMNQQRTDMQRYIRALSTKLKEHDIDLPIDQSIDPEENK